MGNIIIQDPTCLVKLSDLELEILGREYEVHCKIWNFIYEGPYWDFINFERFCVKRIAGEFEIPTYKP